MGQWLSSHWAQIGVSWFVVQNFLKALQDAEDVEPPELKSKPIARMSYYMQAMGSYLFLGNRPTKTGV